MAVVVGVFGNTDWHGELAGFVFLGVFVALPIGLIGLAKTSDSTWERGVSGIAAAYLLFCGALSYPW
jgi:hypothetical protein